MKKFTNWIVKKTIKAKSNIDKKKKIGFLAGWLSIIVNFILAIVKVIFGIFTGSIALIADAVHTISDVLTSIIVIVGFKISTKPADREHPFGHGRMESIATLIISIILFTVSVEFFQLGIKKIIKPTYIIANWFIISIIFVTVILKELLAKITKHLGTLINSKSIEADSWHHRSDAISSLFVIIGFIGSIYGIKWLDGIATLLVSLFIAWVAFGLSKETVNKLLGEAPSKELLEEIINIAKSHENVDGVHDIIVHSYGDNMLVSLHIEVEDKYSAMKVHDISEDVESLLEKKFSSTKAIVHADPINTDHKDYKKIKDFIDKEMENDHSFLSYHDLRIIGSEKRSNILFDIEYDKDLSEKEMIQLRKTLIKKLWETFKMGAIIKIEPKCTYSLI